MKIRKLKTSWKVPKLEIRENLNTRKFPDIQYILFDEYICMVYVLKSPTNEKCE